jgi:hypothetical protein
MQTACIMGWAHPCNKWPEDDILDGESAEKICGILANEEYN